MRFLRLFNLLIRQPAVWVQPQRAGLRGGLRAEIVSASRKLELGQKDITGQKQDQQRNESADKETQIKHISKPLKRGELQATLARLESITKEEVERAGGSCEDIDPLSENLDTEYLDSLAPELPKLTFNVAAIVNHHKPLQRLTQLGVDLAEIERRNRKATQALIKLNDFDSECGPYITWLVKDLGIPTKLLRQFITQFPLTFTEDLDNLKTRVEYLRIKQFKDNQIRTIFRNCPAWLARHTQDVDSKLAFIQREFGFLPQELRLFMTKYPQAIQIPSGKITQTKFSLLEEMGFTQQESRKILMNIPQLLEASWKSILRNFDLIHNESGVPHSHIVRMPQFLIEPHRQLSDRVEYLRKLNKLQLDPVKPLYIPLDALVQEKVSDSDFARKYARTSLDDYNLFLKHV